MKLCIYRTGGAGAQGAAANGGMEPPKPSGPPSVIFFLLEKNRKQSYVHLFWIMHPST